MSRRCLSTLTRVEAYACDAVGPVASVLINCFGCRVTTIVGGLLSAVSLFCSPFSPNIIVFILLFGVVGGTLSSLFISIVQSS